MEKTGFIPHSNTAVFNDNPPHTLTEIISEQTCRALWEVRNVIDCIPSELWNKKYCQMPMWKHVYHMLHSLDLWFINPRDKSFQEPDFHETGLNNLDIHSDQQLQISQIKQYFADVEQKIQLYLQNLTDEQLLIRPSGCEYSRFTLILAQFRHLHSHMGIIMGFIIDDTGLWPKVLGLESPFPASGYDKYF